MSGIDAEDLISDIYRLTESIPANFSRDFIDEIHMDMHGTTPEPSLRKPKQARSVARYNLLLDAAHKLLETQGAEDLGLYQVAKEATMPPASAYHLFPTPSAIVIALADRYQAQINEQVAKAQAPADGMWQTLLRDHMTRIVTLYNANVPMMKVMIGPHASREVQAQRARFRQNMVETLEAISSRVFRMPEIRDAGRRFLVLLTLIDAVWALSYARHRFITPEYQAEAASAAVAYCRTFLPEFVDLRQAPPDKLG